MESISLKKIRATLNKTQKELAMLLGISVKAVHSYEQGWRKIPHHVERHLLFLLSRTINVGKRSLINCWDIKKCPDDKQQKCPAVEFNAGDLCWFVNGTQCRGETFDTWADKMNECQDCKVFKIVFELK